MARSRSSGWRFSPGRSSAGSPRGRLAAPRRGLGRRGRVERDPRTAAARGAPAALDRAVAPPLRRPRGGAHAPLLRLSDGARRDDAARAPLPSRRLRVPPRRERHAGRAGVDDRAGGREPAHDARRRAPRVRDVGRALPGARSGDCTNPEERRRRAAGSHPAPAWARRARSSPPQGASSPSGGGECSSR